MAGNESPADSGGIRANVSVRRVKTDTREVVGCASISLTAMGGRQDITGGARDCRISLTYGRSITLKVASDLGGGSLAQDCECAGFESRLAHQERRILLEGRTGRFGLSFPTARFLVAS